MRIRAVVMGLVMVAVLVVAGCAGETDADVEPEATVLDAEVDPLTVSGLVADGEITVIDVREDWEFAEGHIPGAVLIPLQSLPERLDEVPRDQPVVVACRSGNRSGQAFRFLEGEGFDNVSNMTGGMIAWREHGLEVDK